VLLFGKFSVDLPIFWVCDQKVNVIELDTTIDAASPYALCIPCAIPLGFALGTSENST